MMLGVSGGDLLDRFRIEMERDIGCIFSESRRVQHELTKVFYHLLSPFPILA